MAANAQSPPAKGGAAAGAQGGDTKKATEHFTKGEEAFKAKKFSAALDEFKISYATVPSPNSHLYIARCMVALGQNRDAYNEFDKVVAEVAARNDPKYQPTGDTARVERDELASKLGLVTVTVKGAPSDATLKVGGTALATADWGKPIPVEPGSTEVVVESPSHAPISQSVSVAAGDKKDVTIDAGTPAPPPVVAQPTEKHDSVPSQRKALRPFAYVAAGVGVVGLGVFAVAGTMSNSTYSDLKDACKGPCPPNQGYDSDISRGKTEQTVANIGLVVGVLGIAAGATLFVLSVTGSSSSNQTGSAQASLVVGPGSTGIRGRF